MWKFSKSPTPRRCSAANEQIVIILGASGTRTVKVFCCYCLIFRIKADDQRGGGGIMIITMSTKVQRGYDHFALPLPPWDGKLTSLTDAASCNDRTSITVIQMNNFRISPSLLLSKTCIATLPIILVRNNKTKKKEVTLVKEILNGPTAHGFTIIQKLLHAPPRNKVKIKKDGGGTLLLCQLVINGSASHLRQSPTTRRPHIVLFFKGDHRWAIRPFRHWTRRPPTFLPQRFTVNGVFLQSHITERPLESACICSDFPRL